jgi:hypothetical protein
MRLTHRLIEPLETRYAPAALITISNAGTVNETEGSTAVFTVTLSEAPATGESISVHYATADGTAVQGLDYQTASGTLSFTDADPLSKTITIPIRTDDIKEADETFTINLSDPTNGATIVDGQGVGSATIADDDPIPAISFLSDVVITEGDGGTKTANFTVSLTNPSSEAITVHAATADGTAVAGQDYVAFDQDLSFAPGEKTKTVSVVINGDIADETDEGFTLNLTGPSANATIADSQAVGTIANDDLGIFISNAQVIEGSEGATSELQFTVSLTKPSTHVVTVNASTGNGTAAADSDFVAKSNEVITFNPGETTKTFTVAVNGDATGEDNETLTATLTAPVNAQVAIASATGAILNDDGATLSISDARIVEGGPGQTSQMAFTVALNRFGAAGDFSVGFATDNTGAPQGAATAGVDYTAKTGTLTIPAGANTGTILVPIIGDSEQSEGVEQFFVNLSNASGGATIIDVQATGSIVDDEGVVISIGNATLSEGDAGTANMIFLVTLTGNIPSQGVTVPFSTADGSASSALTGGDYITTTGSLVFDAGGPKQKTIAVPIRGDLVHEGTEQFYLRLTTPTPAGQLLANSEATGTIIDNNDPVPGISISSGSVVEGPASTTNAVFTVSLTNGSDTPLPSILAPRTALRPVVRMEISSRSQGRSPFSRAKRFKPSRCRFRTTAWSKGTRRSRARSATPKAERSPPELPPPPLSDNDIVATIGNVSIAEGNSGNTQGTITVTLSDSPVAGSPVTVNFDVANGTATAGTDFNVVTQSPIVFNPGETTKQIAFDVVGDTRNEANENFTVALTSVTNGVAGANSTGTVTITNDDAAPIISIANASAPEGDSVVFTVSLNAPSDQPITVKAMTTSGTATGTDPANPNPQPDADYTTDPESNDHLRPRRDDEILQRPDEGRQRRGAERDVHAFPVGRNRCHDRHGHCHWYDHERRPAKPEHYRCSTR